MSAMDHADALPEERNSNLEDHCVLLRVYSFHSHIKVKLDEQDCFLIPRRERQPRGNLVDDFPHKHLNGLVFPVHRGCVFLFL